MPARDISWLSAALKGFAAFPAEAQIIMLTALRIAAQGEKADIAKPFKGVGSGVFEVALKHRGDAFIEERDQDAAGGHRSDQGAVETAEESFEMSDDGLEHGSGNVFRDLGHPDADILQIKADLAAKIIHELDVRKLTVRAASALTGFAAADFSRVRRAKVHGFTLDKLVGMLGKLDQQVEFRVAVRRRSEAGMPAPAIETR